MGTNLEVIAQRQVNQDRAKGGAMRLQVLVRQLLEVIQYLLLDDWSEALDLLDKNTFVHLQLTDVSQSSLFRRFTDLTVQWCLLDRVLLTERLIALLRPETFI